MALHRRLAETADLSSAMDRVNADLLDMTPDGKFVTACVGVWDNHDRSWTYCAAGHPAGLLLRKQTIHALTPSAPLLGLFNTSDWPTQQLRLHTKDRLFLYTDGVTDIDESKTEARASTFEQRLLTHADPDLQAQVQRTMTEIRSHTHDDTTLLAIEVL